MDYFRELTRRCDELGETAEAYLAELPDLGLSCCEMAQRIWLIAQERLAAAPEGTDHPWWVESISEGHMPFVGTPDRASLAVHMGFSIEAQEAHLRNLLEIAEGRAALDSSLAFPIIAKISKEEVAAWGK